MLIKSSMKIVISILVISGFVLARAQMGTSKPAQTAAPGSTKSEQSAAPAGKDHPEENYVIGDGDVLGINVWKEQELTGPIPVRLDGKISLPLIGEIQASGRTPTQLKNDITDKLRAYLSAPDVTVTVLQMNSQKFNILGRVSKPGSYPLSATTTVLDGIAAAGGFLDFAKQKGVYILRKNSEGRMTRIAFNYKDVIRGNHPEENIQLRPDDTIVVP
ncbi:polysaccharide biosynthesis/export family protein [Terracidiphilus gabretensis]|uniref:polysaccharide biosynthesis/export family protein n=1 Tax=Terracidiphilus gabretensis TaxID=1577687 RepID=UPI0018D25B24|nr:polysaccharide biosynthesis/export family protein [Terracidiphilus gabretensis]